MSHHWLDDFAGYGVMADSEGVGLFPLDDNGRTVPNVDPLPLTHPEYQALLDAGSREG